MVMGAMDEGSFATEFSGGSELHPVGNGVDGDPVTSAIEDSVRVLLRGLGEDVFREGIRSTPRRVAKAFREGTRGYSQNVKDIVHRAVFSEPGVDDGWVGGGGGDGGLVVVRDLDLHSYCESCLLPFRVKCHIGYIPSSQRVIGLSKISRVADMFSRRLQEPTRLAADICSALHSGIKPAGVAVVLHCSHLRPPLPGADPGPHGIVRSLISSGSGLLRDIHGGMWADLLALLDVQGAPAHTPAGGGRDSDRHAWCPLHAVPPATDPEMVSAAAGILRSLGEDPCRRRELSGTAGRFVGWLLGFGNRGRAAERGRSVPKAAEEEAALSERGVSFAGGIPFWSLCEHHLLPFHGVVHVGYMAGAGGAVERSELEAVVGVRSGRLQVQERLTREMAEGAAGACSTGDVMVVVEAEHTCMSSRGVEECRSSTATVAILGRFSDDPDARSAFFRRIFGRSGHHDSMAE